MEKQIPNTSHMSSSKDVRTESRRNSASISDVNYTEEKMGSWKTDCIERPLARLFYNYGYAIAGKNWMVALLIIGPLILTGALGPGFMFMKRQSSTEYLFTPRDGPAKGERQIIKDTFPFNESGGFVESRRPILDGRTSVVMYLKDEKENILTKAHMKNVFDLDDEIRALETKDEDGNTIKFSEICGRWKDKCVQNTLLTDIYNKNPDLVANVSLEYPLHVTTFIGGQLGGVDPASDAVVTVKSARAIRLGFYVKYEEEEDIKKANLWFDEFHEFLSKKEVTGMKLSYQSSMSMSDELDRASTSIIPMFSITYTILITFSVISCMMFDWVRSKPWLAFAGVVSAGLAIVSSMGLLMYCGVEFTSQVATMPFLAIGIGVDDMFIMVSAWRQTNVNANIRERTAQTMKDAALSITITSITDVLAFGIGAITQFEAIKIFCLYTGIAVLFCYLYGITFFAACLILDGKREEANRHAMAFIKVHPKDEDEEGKDGKCYKIWCAGGGQSSDGLTDHGIMKFFKKYYGPFLMNRIVKAVVLVFYVAYLGVSIWQCTKLKEGLALQNLAPDDSYLKDYYIDDREYFGRYGPRVMVAFTEPVEYHLEDNRQQIFDLIDKIGNSSYFIKEQSGSWLLDFHGYLAATMQTPANMTEFISILKTNFLAHPAYTAYTIDVVFSKDNDKILASRAFVQSKYFDNTNDEKGMMLEARQFATDSPFMTTVYHPAFVFYDQYVVILQNTLQNMGIATGVMLVIALLFVPHPLCAIWVTLSIVSIVVGVFGFMTIWGVSLDSISMINLILCIGFSVDFSAHITYAFITSKGRTKDDKAIDALYGLGLPILQGASSTILGIIVLAFSISYIFRTFFKTMFLVITLGTLHGLVVLPVVLSLCGVSSCCEDGSGDEIHEGGPLKETYRDTRNGRISPEQLSPKKDVSSSFKIPRPSVKKEVYIYQY